MLPFKEHKCGDSKLKCIDCDSQICPKCMIQCPVGNRCPNCTKRFTSHVLQVDPWVILRGLIGGLIAGLLFSLLQTLCPIGGFLILFLVYFIGVFAGNMVLKVAGRKLGGKMAASVASGALIGSLCFIFLYQIIMSMLMSQANVQDGVITPVGLVAASPLSLSFIIFLLGLISPFLGWNFAWPGSRR